MKTVSPVEPVESPSNDRPAAARPRAVSPPLALSEAPRIRTYEELDGGEGRGVFFRPHRYTAAELAPLAGRVSVVGGKNGPECAVLDVSQSGVAVAWPLDTPVSQGQRLRIAVRFDGYEPFRGSARVGSVRERGETKVVGISFENYLLDVEELLQLRGVRAWEAKRAGDPAHGRSLRVEGGERFQALVAELRLLLEDAKEELDALETTLPWSVLQGPQGHPAQAALVASLRGDFVAEANRLSEEIDAAVRDLPGKHANEAAKEWSQRHVDEYLMQAPILHRARHKPFGYPGDYEVMNFIYERNFEGTTLFARAVGLAFTNSCAAKAVRYRKDLVKRQIRALLERRTGSRKPVRILSIAAGPAQELFELANELEDVPVPLEVVLFEQDKNALAHAWRRLSAAVEARFPREVQLTFLHDSVKRLLRDARLFEPFGTFDLVYSAGLFDYFQERTAVVLARHLASAVAPGGQLLVANMVDHPSRWIMEHHLDWPLIYRTRQQLLDMGARAVPGAQLRILEEESGANPFIEFVVT